jgi:hypothetical protein
VSRGRTHSRGEVGENEQRPAPWLIHFFQRHRDDDPAQAVPARDFLNRCPVAARMAAVLKAVTEAPPNAFAGGGYWEAMHGTMAGYYEVRVDGRDRRHYRLFCVLERDGARLGLGGPSVVVLTGWRSRFERRSPSATTRACASSGTSTGRACRARCSHERSGVTRGCGDGRRATSSIGHELEVVVERGGHLQDRADGRVPACIGEQAAHDLRLHRDPPGELRLRESAAGSGALERANERVGRHDLRSCDLEIRAELGVAEPLVQVSVEPRLARHGKRNLYATLPPGKPRLACQRANKDPGCGPAGPKRK